MCLLFPEMERWGDGWGAGMTGAADGRAAGQDPWRERSTGWWRDALTENLRSERENSRTADRYLATGQPALAPDERSPALCDVQLEQKHRMPATPPAPRLAPSPHAPPARESLGQPLAAAAPLVARVAPPPLASTPNAGPRRAQPARRAPVSFPVELLQASGRSARRCVDSSRSRAAGAWRTLADGCAVSTYRQGQRYHTCKLLQPGRCSHLIQSGTRDEKKRKKGKENKKEKTRKRSGGHDSWHHSMCCAVRCSA